jgi:hypothetical protein
MLRILSNLEIEVEIGIMKLGYLLGVDLGNLCLFSPKEVWV